MIETKGVLRPEFDYENGAPGAQIYYRFPNGYGASIINHKYSYGNELVVLRFDRKTGRPAIIYDTPVTDTVIGYLNNRTLGDVLAKIEALPDERNLFERFTDWLGFTPAPMKAAR